MMPSANALRQAVQVFDLDEHAERLDDRERDASLGLLAMVVGSGNFGKSSLINALCGRTVAAVSVIPKTFKIDVFTNGEAGTALVRHVGEARAVVYSHEKARQIEAEFEKNLSSRDGAKLAEIVWRYEGLNLPQGISIVDTPGISQALGKTAKSISLTSVLGSTFEVDEVWARWFHRADVVLWAFSANKMEDADTQIALEAALNLFDKPIIPVATKADLIPVERWPEISERFNTIYGPLLQDRQAGDLQLTVCGGRNAELAGTGIAALHDSLERIASVGLAVKQQAQEAFVRDESLAVATMLDETAKTLVANLQAIASLGDVLAEEALKEAERGRVEAVHRVNGYLNGVRRESTFGQVVRAVNEVTNGGRSGDAEAEARARLLALIDAGKIEREVNEAFAMCARSLEATAERLSQGTEIAKLSFKSSGKIVRQAAPLRLKLRAFSVTSRLDFDLKLEGPSGFLSHAWDIIKRLLGLNRFSLADIQNAMTSALAIPETEFAEAMQQTIRDAFVPALREAVEAALRTHLQSSDAQALDLLRDVDAFLPLLSPAGTPMRTTTYGPQAEYWATLLPDVETLLDLARNELTRLLPDFRELLREPLPFDPPEEFPAFGGIWQGRTQEPGRVTVSVGLGDVLRVVGDGAFLPYLTETQFQYLRESPIVAALDERLEESVIGARYRSAGLALAREGAKAFETALSESKRVWTASIPQEQVWRLTLGRGTLAGSTAGVLGGLAFMFLNRGVAGLCLVFAVAWFAFGVFRPYLVLMARYRAGIGQAVLLEVRNCQADAATLVSNETVDTVIDGMVAELAPRPLQRLLIDLDSIT